ncbi:uncharacterized protein C24B11.05-like [Typha latifolia]|uniref:uncharacterized protein C24B11.05-like n=1 Tax=Typha latifolia TaxID=4733 RepID=UPI003C2C57EC
MFARHTLHCAHPSSSPSHLSKFIVMDFHSPFHCVLIDLDDTLYPSTAGISLACKRNIEEFLAMKCGVPADRAYSLRVELFHTYGSSLSGLIALGYDVHPDEYHSYVHGRLPYERIAPDPQLNKLLKTIPQPKILFTNSDRMHMKKVLERLGIKEECFHGIVCFETLNPNLYEKGTKDAVSSTEVILKPSLAAMETAVRSAGFDPHQILFLDDSERNIAAAKAMGLVTALVGKKGKIKETDYLIDSIHSLRQAIPEVWGVMKTEKGVRSDLDSIRTPNPIEA